MWRRQLADNVQFFGVLLLFACGIYAIYTYLAVEPVDQFWK